MDCSQDSQLPPLVRNCVTAIRIDGLAVDHDGKAVTLDLPRQSPGEVRQEHHGDVPPGYVGPYYVPEMPKANPPVHPRPDQPLVRLHLQLGDIVSFNERHAVYNVIIIKADPPAFYIPPLVIKLARTDEAGRVLSQEAAMYEHIRKLQGVVAPRFYGYFHAKDRSSEWSRVSPRGSKTNTGVSNVDEVSTFPVDPKDEEPFNITPEEPPACTRTDILLLEKVGEHLPPPSPPGLPGKRSPYHKRVYRLRLIDFEGAKLTTRTPGYQRMLIQDQLPGLYSHIMAP